MPFKSEAQRRYLWANEPEIARDWTDTYGSRIQKNNGGIMRLPFAEGSGEGVDYADNDIMVKVELLREQYPDKYHEDMVSDEEMVEMVKANEVEEIGDDTRWFEQPTLERMWNDPNRPENFGLGSMRDWATDKINWGREKIGTGIGAGIDWSKMAMRGVGNLIAPGLGFVLGALPQDTAAQKFNRRFTVGGANMPTDTYGYYNQLRHGNIDQDPFGRNPVSMFGNYSKSLLGDLNYEGDSKFKKAKADYAQKYFNQKAAEYAPQEDININVTPAYSGGDKGGNGGNGGGGRYRGDPGGGAKGSPFYRGGIADLWPR